MLAQVATRPTRWSADSTSTRREPFQTARFFDKLVDSSLEMRKTPRDIWAVTAGFGSDYWSCESRNPELECLGPSPEGNAFGIASGYTNTTVGSVLKNVQFWAEDFTRSYI